MKILKYVAFTLGGLFALVGGAALLIYATFDANRLKNQVTQIVKEKKDRALYIDGDVALSFWPSIGVELARVRLSERGSEQQFAAVDSVRVSLAVIPLLSKQVVVDHLEVSGVNATLIRTKDGKLNIDDLLSKDEEQSEAVRFDVSGVRLTNSQLIFRDDKFGEAATLSALNLTTGPIGNRAEGELKLDGKLVAEQRNVATDVEITAAYNIDIDKKQFALSGFDARTRGEAMQVKQLDLAIRAKHVALASESGSIEVEQLESSARGGLQQDKFEMRLAVPKISASHGKLSADSAELTVNATESDRTADAKLALSGADLSGTALKLAGVALEIEAKRGGNLLKATAASPMAADLETQRFELSGLSLTLDMQFGENALKGKLTLPLSGNLQAMNFDLPKISGNLDVANPRMPMRTLRMPLNGAFRVDVNKQAATGQLSTRFDESTITTKFNLAKFTPLALNFDVDVDRLNVDRYLPPVSRDGKQPIEAEKPIDLSALKGLNASGAVRVGYLQVANIKASNVKLQIKAAGGKLEVSPHSASLYEGVLAGNLSVDANTNGISARESLTNVSINPLMRDVLAKDLLEGRGNLMLDLSTTGNTATAMKRALGGSARLALRDGAIKGINLAKSLREFKAQAGGLKQNAEQKAVSTEKTDFSEMTATLRLANGVARNDDLVVKSPFLRVTGAGDLNIADGNMAYTAKATVVNTATGQEGKELSDLKGVTIPVHVSGPFDALTYKLAFADLAADIAKAKLDEKKQELQKKIGEKVQSEVQDRLKGVLTH